MCSSKVDGCMRMTNKPTKRQFGSMVDLIDPRVKERGKSSRKNMALILKVDKNHM